jgi:hypothetical protein
LASETIDKIATKRFEAKAIVQDYNGKTMETKIEPLDSSAVFRISRHLASRDKNFCIKKLQNQNIYAALLFHKVRVRGILTSLE